MPIPRCTNLWKSFVVSDIITSVYGNIARLDSYEHNDPQDALANR
jgi:hypothetical protein